MYATELPYHDPRRPFLRPAAGPLLDLDLFLEETLPLLPVSPTLPGQTPARQVMAAVTADTAGGKSPL